MTEPTTYTVDVPGAVITYDVRISDRTREPALVLIGNPMGASGFEQLASHLTDRTLVTYDPRGIERSRKTDGVIESNPDQHADDVHAVIEAVGGGPVDLFGSSGGAVVALALVARHPADTRTVIAHEPPLASQTPDREFALAANRDVHETYLRQGHGPAMAKFIRIVSHRGPITAEFLSQPAPDPAMFGLSSEDDGSRDDILLGQNILGNVEYEPDFDALRAAPARIVVAAGATSDSELAHRGADAVAERLGTVPVLFPGGHGGFFRNEWDPSGDPEAFAAKLREVLSAD